MSTDVGIFVAGLISSLASLSHLEGWSSKSTWLRVLLLLGIVGPATALCLQFWQTQSLQARAKRKADGRLAIAIAAYAAGRTPEVLARVSGGDDFLVGYLQFRKGQWDQATVHFDKLITENEFVAPSHYLLAFMNTHDTARRLDRSGDWPTALEHLDQATAHDGSYAPAHYLKAILLAEQQRPEEALRELKAAVMEPSTGAACCLDLNEEGREKFPGLQIAKLQAACRELHSLAPVDGTP